MQKSRRTEQAQVDAVVPGKILRRLRDSIAFSDIAPALATIAEAVLFGEVWKRPALSPRDRSLVTVAPLIALYRTKALPFTSSVRCERLPKGQRTTGGAGECGSDARRPALLEIVTRRGAVTRTSP